jgi:hypothetical protein
MSEKDMQALVALIEKALGAAWIDATEWLRGIPANSLALIEARLVAGDIAGAVAQVEKVALQIAAEMQAAYIQSGRRVALWMNEHPAMRDRLIRFDGSGSRVVDYSRRNRLDLVQGMREESQAVVRNVMVEGAKSGTNPRVLAREIRETIGLTENQAIYVQNYRRALEQGNWSKALGYELRDGRADRTMARLARDGGSLSPEQIERLTESYRKAQIAWRAENIARSEAGKVAHQAA